MSSMRKVFWGLYGIQTFFVVPLFLGAIHRGETAFWPLHSQHADGWATAIDLYLHLLFYSVFYVLPYHILRAAYNDDIPPNTEVFFVPISLWFLATVMLFHTSIFDFIVGLIDAVFNESAPAWYQWLHILWVVFTFFVFIFWRAILSGKAELRKRREWESRIS